MYIYIYIYICVCVCVFILPFLHEQNVTQGQTLIPVQLCTIYIYIYIYIYISCHTISTDIPDPLSCHTSLSSIASGRSSELHPA